MDIEVSSPCGMLDLNHGISFSVFKKQRPSVVPFCGGQGVRQGLEIIGMEGYCAQNLCLCAALCVCVITWQFAVEF